MKSTTLLQNALIVPGGNATPFHGWIEILGDNILEVGHGTPPERPRAMTIDGGGGIVMPGLVNTHAHCHSSLTRGSAEGVALDQWLTVIEREQSQLTAEQLRVGALATYAEALLSGTTSIMDMCLHPRIAFLAAREIGIRAVIAPYVADGKPFTPTLDQTAELLDESEDGDGRVRVWVGLHDLESCSDAQIVAGVTLAHERGAGLHLHCSETAGSIDRTQRRTGRTPVAQLAELGALGGRTVLAHCVWVDAADRERLAATGTHVAHCPHANLKLGSGVAPTPTMLKAGINVALATDGAKANNRLDLFDVMKFASLLPKGFERDPGLLPAPKVIEMATSAGAAALGAPGGRIVVGAAADLVLLRPGLHLEPLAPETVQTNLVHAARGSDVAMVMVAGHVLVEDGRLTRIDQDELSVQMRRVGLDLLSRSGAPA